MISQIIKIVTTKTGLILIFLSYFLVGCGDNEPKKKSNKKEIYITTSKAKKHPYPHTYIGWRCCCRPPRPPRRRP